jgi:hypothetical protein
MKRTFDDYVQNEWKKISSKLSHPITQNSSFFSQESAQLVFIFLLFIIISDTSNVIQFSQSISGRISVVIILFYFTMIHPMVGAMLSMAMILYYHSDLVKAYYYETILYQNTPSTLQEGLSNQPDDMLFHDNQEKYELNTEHFNAIQQQQQQQYKIEKQDWEQRQKDHQEYIDTLLKQKTERFQNMEASTLSSAYPFTTDIQTISSKHSPWFRPVFFNEYQMREGFESIPPTIEQSHNTSEYSLYRTTYEQPIDTKLQINLPTTNKTNTINTRQRVY